MHQILILLSMTLVIISSSHPIHRFTSYNEYLEAWKSVVSAEYIHDVSSYALPGQECNGPCKFFYYQHHNPNFTQAVNQRTILLVAGMHGNQFIGPHALLYAYLHLEAYRIIYFPVANPSGFIRQQRKTYPGEIDINRDYPIDGNTQCYRATATRIIDMLFRKYKFDLTVTLHNGGQQIGFNWGTKRMASKSHTVEYQIYRAIADMMDKQGGPGGRRDMTRFKTGTMTESVYPASGTFDDWAYAMSKHPQFTSECKDHQYEPYPEDMSNSLVFLIETGPFKTNYLGDEQAITAPPGSQNEPTNGHVTRTIRILKKLMDLYDPHLEVRMAQEEQIEVSVVGCKTAVVSDFQVKKKSGEEWVSLIEMKDAFTTQGDVRYSDPTGTVLNVKPGTSLALEDEVRFSGKFTCDKEWVGLGTSFLATTREYQFDTTTSLLPAQVRPVYLPFVPSYFPGLSYMFEVEESTQHYLWMGLTLVVLVMLVVLAVRLWRRYCRRKAEKFEEVEYAGEHQYTQQGEDGGDLHTARGGIIEM